MAIDSWVPHRFSHLSDHLVTRYGIWFMGIASLAFLTYTAGDVRLLVVMYSINVFLTFTLSQLGMCRHWFEVRSHHPGWLRKFLLNGVGLLLTAIILVVTLVFKFAEGGWVTAAVTSLFVLICYIVRAHDVADEDEKRRDRGGHPAAFGEFEDQRHDENDRGEQKADAVQQKFPQPPWMVAAHLKPVAAHAELRQRKREKQVDAVHHHQQPHVAGGVREKRERCDAHEPDAVAGHEMVAEMGEAMRHPRVDRHIGEHAGPVDKAGLRGDEQKRRLAQQRDHDHGINRAIAGEITAVNFFQQRGIERLTRLVRDMV